MFPIHIGTPGPRGGWLGQRRVSLLGGSPGRFREAVRASQLAKKSQDKTLGVFVYAVFDFDGPGPQNTAQKSKNKEKYHL